jgi:hypothetical protein
MRISSIGIVQTAKTLAAPYARIGVIIGIVAFFVYLFAPAHSVGGHGILTAMLALVFIPIIYAITGSIAIAIAAWIYNLVANKTGGVEFTATKVGLNQ